MGRLVEMSPYALDRYTIPITRKLLTRAVACTLCTIRNINVSPKRSEDSFDGSDLV